MFAGSSCSQADCPERAVTSLGERDFCLGHFCMRCYELLERVHWGADLTYRLEEFSPELFALDELPRRTLEVSFSGLTLNNLDRARLLDILLWAGELTSKFRHLRTAAPAWERWEAGAGSRSAKSAQLARRRPDVTPGRMFPA